MHSGENSRTQKLEPGQVWRVEQGYLYIVELGERLIRYKMLRHPNCRAAITQIIRWEPMLNFLKHTQAELIHKEQDQTIALAA